MFASFLLALREGLEAALIIGILLSTLKKIRREDLQPAIRLGALSAIAISLGVGFSLNALGATLSEHGEQIFEGIAMLLAAAVLTWMVFWMAQQAGNFKQELEAEVRLAATQATSWPLFLLAFLAIIREGVELALFLTAVRFASGGQEILLGAAMGLGLAALMGWGLYRTTYRLNLQRFFRISGGLLLLFAAGLVAHGVHEFNEVGWIPPLIEQVWNLNPILDERSLVGSLLAALFGYNGNPSLSEVLAYLTYLGAIALGLRRQQTRPYALPQKA